MTSSVASPNVPTSPSPDDWTLTLKANLTKLAASSSLFEDYPGTPIYEARRSQLARIENGWRVVLLSYAKDDIANGITGIRRKRYWTECECLLAYELRDTEARTEIDGSEGSFFDAFVKYANYIPCPQFLTGVSVEEIAEKTAPESGTMDIIGETHPSSLVGSVLTDDEAGSPPIEVVVSIAEPAAPAIGEVTIVVPDDIPTPTSPLSRGIEILPTAFSYPSEKVSPKKQASKTKPKAKRSVTPSKISSWNVNVVGTAQEQFSRCNDLPSLNSRCPSPSSSNYSSPPNHDVEAASSPSASASNVVTVQTASLSSRIIRAFSLVSFIGFVGFWPARVFRDGALRAMTLIGIHRK
ncbi:uncharacterized protein EI90DRAFT_3131723 [Cantharellus anzutake]|uniref:uncharacterized protein n=1 Tax=Cantharellus anzutake TaxID=1750568 RepID=UPI00190739E9|nr:uncharacterized protein EI90DRAFT_3131723 [Cantharellus anzutake]KAF8321079.1 hypothetical protein EI90DRAFT_3131723 [Cantharellus anzutake]